MYFEFSKLLFYSDTFKKQKLPNRKKKKMTLKYLIHIIGQKLIKIP